MLFISLVTNLHQKKFLKLGQCWNGLKELLRRVGVRVEGGGRVKELRLLTQQKKVSDEIQFLSRNIKGQHQGWKELYKSKQNSNANGHE